MTTTATPTVSTPASVTAVPVSTPRLRLEHLDGIRGLASLVVLICHSFAMLVYLLDEGRRIGPTGEKILLFVLRILLHYGHVSVCVFIVLSGYCLMLPTVTTKRPEERGRLKGGFGGYIYRRARRIIPPYMVALLFASLVRAIPGVSVPGMLWITKDDPVPGWDDYLSHALLIHNFRADWMGQINPAFWSIAVEWQIYFFFPLLLLPIWRRAGNIPVLAVAIALVVAVQLAFSHNPGALYIAYFTVGMVAAALNFDVPMERLKGVPFVPLMVGGFILQAVLQLLQRASWETHSVLKYIQFGTWGGTYPADIGIAVATLCLLVFLTRKHQEKQSSFPVLRFLESKPVLWLGAISYSLYLIHMPILQMLAFFDKQLALPTVAAPLLFCVGPVIGLTLATVFHRYFERPFMSTASKKADKA